MNDFFKSSKGWCGCGSITTTLIFLATFQLIYVVSIFAETIFALDNGLAYYQSKMILHHIVPFNAIPPLLATSLLWILFIIALFYAIKTTQAPYIVPFMVMQIFASTVSATIFVNAIIQTVLGESEQWRTSVMGITGISIAVIVCMFAAFIVQTAALKASLQCFKYFRCIRDVNGQPAVTASISPMP